MNGIYQDNLLPPFKEIVDYWSSRHIETGIFIDIGEPSCWACQQGWNGKYDLKQNSKKCYGENWKKAPLQRCHIVPKSLGGSDKPENIILMCKECHDLAPNTIFPAIMFEWMRSQHWFKRDSKKLLNAMCDFEIGESELERVEETIRNAEFKNWVQDKSGLHWPQSGYSGTAYKLTMSTMIGLVKYYWKIEARKS